MKIDLTHKITGINKEIISDKEGELTLKRALLISLVAPDPNPQGTSAEEALKIRRLFNKIDDAEKEIDLKSDEIVRLNELVAKRLSAFIAGAVILYLEPDA